jgi:isopenicillin-N epimerase
MNPCALGLHWNLKPGLTFLNHGSFGLAPRELLRWRFELLAEIEQDPVAFLTSELQPRLDQARQVLADLVEATPEQLAFVPSTTYGLNELLQRLELPPGSEVLLPDHGYNATVNLVRFACEQRGWTLRMVPIPLPLEDPAQVVEAFAAAFTPATRLLVVDHITSPTALVLPIEQLIALAREREARIIIDGAHGPGSVPLQLQQWQPDAYVGNLHKWLCCPRGAAFLWVRDPWRHCLRPLVVSHGANAPLAPGTTRFHLEHDWIGTADPTPWLALPEALRLLTGTAHPESGRIVLQELQHRNNSLAQQGQQLLLERFGLKAPLAPLTMQAAMASVLVPQDAGVDGNVLQSHLLAAGVQAPVIPLIPYSNRSASFLRISCFAYNELCDIERLVSLLPALV